MANKYSRSAPIWMRLMLESGDPIDVKQCLDEKEKKTKKKHPLNSQTGMSSFLSMITQSMH